jgi:hypothetical protein
MRPLSWSVSAPDVDQMRDRFEVLGVHAVSGSAEVVEFEACWYRSASLLVGAPVR